ncbi:MAG TPA: hypothetical protein VFM68_03025 [Candidatus Saccharimonadales bacterium]|nr:hypothetical protein [Candidatus Saccharimonadales bacterium]
MAPISAITEYMTSSGIVMVAQGTCRMATYDAFPQPGLPCDDIQAGGYEFGDGRLRPGVRFSARVIVAFKPKRDGNGYMLIDFMPWPDDTPPEEAFHQLIRQIEYNPRIPY